MLTADQIKQTFREVSLRSLAKSDAVIATEMADRGCDPEAGIRDDICRHGTCRWLAARGPNAVVDDAMANRMRPAGVSEPDVYAVAWRRRVPHRCRFFRGRR